MNKTNSIIDQHQTQANYKWVKVAGYDGEEDMDYDVVDSLEQEYSDRGCPDE